ncbi:hypothetical protein BX264_7137 [Streptomyces sp. 2333.5]|uniref:hypothetical protein n=1 Tax=unclassified Streptomyces TaxID=2593676 RepID=UPI00089D8AC0|nr:MULTISPECIES: hypothetical protein [unclassified Streptomyces]PJI99761.1 hypothetical protein BX264_0009 [Streptomyces sp. 2333.5]PJJ06595.1 hypothetical protein BX264_7137 [Streptomyces sp. 2333.5]SEB58396.1 hypothetical protein SAMN05428943_0009 [Streptomyces sp. 2314.4]SEC39000.1 hypothetical protein SAMN05428942_0009 [Streptomyces sp. 2112.2]
MRRPHRRRTSWPPPRAGSIDITCPAPSATPGHPFTLTLTGTWEEIPSPRPHHTPEAAATHHALVIARNITSTLTPADSVLAAAHINTLLGRPADIPHIPVRLTWAQVSLTADTEALTAASRYERHQHEEEQRRAEQRRNLDQARALQDTVMSDPSLALAYWYATAPHAIDEKTLPRLEQLHAQAAAYAPQGRWALLARLLHTFAEDLTEDAKNHLIDTVALLTDRYGHPDIARQIRELSSSTSTENPIPDGDTAR